MDSLEPTPKPSTQEAETMLRQLNEYRVNCISSIPENPYSVRTLADFFSERTELDAILHEFPLSLGGLFLDFKVVYDKNSDEIFKKLSEKG